MAHGTKYIAQIEYPFSVLLLAQSPTPVGTNEHRRVLLLPHFELHRLHTRCVKFDTAIARTRGANYVCIIANSVVRYTSHTETYRFLHVNFLYRVWHRLAKIWQAFSCSQDRGPFCEGWRCSFPCTTSVSETTVNRSSPQASGEHRGALCFASCVEAFACCWVGLRCFGQKK